MAKRLVLVACLGATLALAACNSGPSSSGSSAAGEDEAAALERKADHLEGLLAARPLAARALDALTLALPDRARLTEVVYDANGIQVKGNAPTNNVLADYLSRLGESPALADVVLRGSNLRTVRGREQVEFLLQAAVGYPGPAAASGPPAARLEALEKALPSRVEPSEMLRELQRLALESGLQMTKFVPGVEVAGEFTGELAATIEVAGGLSDLGRYLRGLAAPSRLWIVEKLSIKAVSAGDPRSDVRASVAAISYFLR